ncbi:MAG: hypothetical protein ABSF94_12085 [Steroidobacteraceae bacterium]
MAIIALQVAVILALPCVLAGAVAYFAWDDLRRPWLYLLVAIVVLYGVCALTFAFIGDTVPGLLAAARGDAAPDVTGAFSGLVLLKYCSKPLLGFGIMALPILAGVYAIFRREP